MVADGESCPALWLGPDVLVLDAIRVSMDG